jgi:membrane protein implicated in regulation of membrane protease activity
MHPYIILLLLPIIGIVVFWLLPLPLAILAYIVILIISALLYWVIARAMKKRSRNGMEGLVGYEAMVVSELGPHDEARYMVRVRGELWVKILSVNGLTLQVKKISAESTSSH